MTLPSLVMRNITDSTFPKKDLHEFMQYGKEFLSLWNSRIENIAFKKNSPTWRLTDILKMNMMNKGPEQLLKINTDFNSTARGNVPS